MNLSNKIPEKHFSHKFPEKTQHQDRDLIASFLESDMDSVLGEFSEQDQNFEFAFN